MAVCGQRRNPMSAHFFPFFFLARLSSIVAKERSFSRIDLDGRLKERLGRVESTACELQERESIPFFGTIYTFHSTLLHSGGQVLWGATTLLYMISH